MWPTSLLGYSSSLPSRIRPGRPRGRLPRRAARPLAVEQLEDRCLLAATLALDIHLGTRDAFPDSMVNVNGTLFFVAETPATGRELWKTDGTAEGTVFVKDIKPGPSSTLDPSPLWSAANVNGTLFFRASDGDHDDELWKSDGTAAGTVRVTDIGPNLSRWPKVL